MPNCFQLRKKGVEQASKFVDIDNDMCAHFGVPPDDVKYYMGWYDYVGLLLAIGKTFDDIADELRKDLAKDAEGGHVNPWAESMLAITLWLQENYESSAWYESSAYRKGD